MLLTPLRQLTQQQLDEYLDRQIKIRELLLDMDRKTAALPAH